MSSGGFAIVPLHPHRKRRGLLMIYDDVSQGFVLVNVPDIPAEAELVWLSEDGQSLEYATKDEFRWHDDCVGQFPVRFLSRQGPYYVASYYYHVSETE